MQPDLTASASKPEEMLDQLRGFAEVSPEKHSSAFLNLRDPVSLHLTFCHLTAPVSWDEKPNEKFRIILSN